MKCDHMEPMGNEKKNNKERPQNQHVGNSLKSGIAKRRSSKMKRDERRKTEGGSVTDSVAAEARLAAGFRCYSSMWTQAC